MKALNIKQVADKLSLGQSTICRMIANGDFPQSFSLGGSRRAWLEEDVNAWLAAKATGRRQSSTHTVGAVGP